MHMPIEAHRDFFNPAARGYHAVYRENEINHCPGCGRTHWHIGRLLAECAFCSTALPLTETYARGSFASSHRFTGRRGQPIFTARAA
ncbi:hypothetical protein HMF7854_05815 [Sphingomonas ginkgonis]|uniref:Uncharacterized protein n=1 Tax=Sphingomonas ginkgonis TaxID=2315330 RepID=A0A429V8T5_9SPHN|nr:hypothetical protein [Sphingomonas ginkgonis]RST30393.1 hypothetical protein HMF7854_05815 [Sphingomonas ginkgonis]